MPSKKISVLLVDDSAVVRQVLLAIFNDTPDIHVMGAASDPIFAMDKLAREWPDVIVLDVEMPRMDGITFLRKIMSERPTPVVICSSLTQKGAETSLQALSAGAVEVITKPTTGLKNFLIESAPELVAAIRAAAHSNVKNLGKRSAARHPPRTGGQTQCRRDPARRQRPGHGPDHRTYRRHRHLHRRHSRRWKRYSRRCRGCARAW